MTEILDDSWEFETFRILNKYMEHPKDLTDREKRRLLELNIKT